MNSKKTFLPFFTFFFLGCICSFFLGCTCSGGSANEDTCKEGDFVCEGNSYKVCHNGIWDGPHYCTYYSKCSQAARGCLPCGNASQPCCDGECFESLTCIDGTCHFVDDAYSDDDNEQNEHFCGNSTCEPEIENCEICPEDCRCPDTIPFCVNGECVECITTDDCHGDKLFCDAGVCRSICPEAKDCHGLQCGPDPVCGISCGECDNREYCELGVCKKVPPDDLPNMINIDGEFYIDPRETSVSEFQQCIDAAECTSENYIEHRCVGRDATHYRCNIGRPGGSSLPANCISSRGAEEYCAFKGKRLCTKEEWRKACRGPANTRYPWGDHSWDIEHNWCICNVDSHGDSNCSFHDHGSGTPCAQAELSGVINCPGCLYFHSTTSGECSFNNLFDIIGNVAEWVIDDDGSYVGMGGSFGTGDMAADCDNTSYPSPDIEYDWRNFGIRCCW